MKITEEARQDIEDTLNEQGSSLWVKLVSQVHGFGNEGIFWFLVDGPEVIPSIFLLFRDVIRRPLALYDETEFTVSFHEKRDGHKLTYEVIEDDELRSGRLRWAIGSTPPDVRPLREADVFGVNDGVPPVGKGG